MKKYIRNSKTISGRLHDEMVMMNLEHGKYYSLNPVATRIWDLLEEPMDADALCSVLMNEFEVSPERCHAEIVEYLAEMLKIGLILEKN